MKQNDPKFYSITDVAKMLNLKISKIRSAIFRRELKKTKLGRLVRISHEQLMNWIEKGYER